MNRKILYVVLIAQLLALGGLYAYHQAGLGYPLYRLRTVPVDPRDLLRGDYVILRYEISRLPDGVKPDSLGTNVWVTLKPDGDAWKIDRVESYRGGSRGDDVANVPVLRAKREGSNLIYDLERFYVPEGTGQNAPPSGKLVVEVAVRSNGAAQIKRVLDPDGRPWPK